MIVSQPSSGTLPLSPESYGNADPVTSLPDSTCMPAGQRILMISRDPGGASIGVESRETTGAFPQTAVIRVGGAADPP